CEEAEIAPEISIEVSTERGEIVIADNGPGLPSATLGGVLDYTVRISSREAYVSPSRGQQGSASSRCPLRSTARTARRDRITRAGAPDSVRDGPGAARAKGSAGHRILRCTKTAPVSRCAGRKRHAICSTTRSPDLYKWSAASLRLTRTSRC